MRKNTRLAKRKPDQIYTRRPDGSVRYAGGGFAAPLATRSLLSNWTPESGLAAISQAEAGALDTPAACASAIMRDDRVTGALSPRVEGMLGLPLAWEGETPERWDTLAPQPELAKLLRNGIILGVGWAKVQPNGALQTWSSEHFSCDRRTQQWSVNTTEGKVEIQAGKGDWVSYRPYGEIDPQLYGLWLTLLLPWMVKRYSLHDRARASEVFGSAMIVGKAPEGATEEMRQDWLADLRRLARNSRIVLPDVDYALELIEAQGQTWGIYQQAIEWADQALTVPIAGQTVTVEGTKGFARGDVHERVARSLLRYTARSFEQCLAVQYVKPVWGSESKPSYITASPDELIGEGEAMTKLATGITDMNAQLAVEGKRVDIGALVKKYGIAVKDVETKVQAPTIAMAPADAVVVISVDEARAASGLKSDPVNGAKAFLQYKAEQEAAIAPAAPAPVEAAAVADDAGAIAPPANATPDALIKFADEMTRLGIERCVHEKKNSCPLCRIRRAQVAPPFKGAPFPLVWEPILASAIAQTMGSSVRASAVAGAAVPEPLKEFRVFAFGPNLTNHRPTYLTREGAASIARAYTGRDVMIDLEHLSIDPGAENYDPDARGQAQLELRDDGLYAVNVRWNEDGLARIAKGTQGYISPYYDVTPSGVITWLTNMALTALPAMYYPPRVAA